MVYINKKKYMGVMYNERYGYYCYFNERYSIEYMYPELKYTRHVFVGNNGIYARLKYIGA